MKAEVKLVYIFTSAAAGNKKPFLIVVYSYNKNKISPNFIHVTLIIDLVTIDF